MSIAGLDFQLFFEESPDVLLVLLPDSPRFTAVAATKARLLSTHSTLEETVGRGLFELFPDNPDDPDATGTANLRASLERVLASKAPDTMAVQKYDIPLPDGTFEVKYWSPRNIPILSAAGEVLYILHRAVDVTELARASEEGEELRGRTQDMEREVVRRSRELDAANRRLREANDKLSELDAAKTAFFSNVSHEFRTPLTLMLGPLEDCLSDATLPLAADHRLRLSLAHANALRLLKLVNALLDFSRLEAGRLQGRFAPVNLAALTRDLADMFRGAFEEAQLTLTLDCPDVSGATYIDKDMWEKIVPNLVSNAFKFTFSGGVVVRVRDTPTHAIVQVIDTGGGIPEAELPRIFDRFHRVAGAVGRTHEGAGIGLALVRELVEVHGGKIAVESAVGRGTEFRIEIPKGFAHLPPDAVVHEAAVGPGSAANDLYASEAARWRGPEPAAPVPAAPVPAAPVPAAPVPAAPETAAAETAAAESAAALAAPSQAARVLVVEDNADLRAYMTALLRPHYQVSTARDGLEALAAIQIERPDIVLSDVMMPRMSGIELVQALRNDADAVNLPVILLSARAGGEAAFEGLDAGADDYLTKPFTAQELLGRVRSLLKLTHLRLEWAAELEAANRELDAFGYSVAHDLRAPLRAIDGFSEMLLEEDAGRLDEQGLRRLGIIRNSAQRMARLIDDLLYLAKVSRGPARRSRFDLSVLARTVATELQEREGERQALIEIEEGLEVDADPQLLQIVLENLLGNALKFTAKCAAAKIEFAAEMQAGVRCYYVRDNGAGFDMAYVSKLFGVFQRLHPERDFAGMGIGLATVKRIIDRHEGRVWAVGDIGRGATFYFTIGSEKHATTVMAPRIPGTSRRADSNEHPMPNSTSEE